MALRDSHKRDICLDYLEKNSEMPTQTLAKMIYKKHPEYFKSWSAVRNMLRRMRKEFYGKGNAKKIKVYDELGDKFVRTKEEIKKAQGWRALPDSDYEELKPFEIPKGNNRIGILSDIHLPYHDKAALGKAL
jgi:hypothetical protein